MMLIKIVIKKIVVIIKNLIRIRSKKLKELRWKLKILLVLKSFWITVPKRRKKIKSKMKNLLYSLKNLQMIRKMLKKRKKWNLKDLILRLRIV